MSVRSHLDLCTYLVFMHVSKDEISSDLINFLDNEIKEGGTPWVDLNRMLAFRSRQTLFHETYHFWQGLRLPFLYRYALLSIPVIWHAFRDLSNNSKNINEWSCILPQLMWIELDTFIGFIRPYTIYKADRKEDLPLECEEIMQITITDMLECAASVAEFQVMTPSKLGSDYNSFRKWKIKNPAYTKVLNFVARLFGDADKAIRIIVPLINTCFYTTDPLRCFPELLARAAGALSTPDGIAFYAQKEPCRWPDFFEMLLDRVPFEGETNSSALIVEPRFLRLTLDHWVFGGLGDTHQMAHPCLGPPARDWIRREEKEPGYKWLIHQPGWAKEEVLETARTLYCAPFNLIRFHLGSGQDKVVIGGTGGIGPYATFLSAQDTLKQFVADWLPVYGAVRRASGAHFDPDQRTCHHEECAYYAANYCNAYPIVPKHHSDCGFPARIERIMKLIGGTA